MHLVDEFHYHVTWPLWTRRDHACLPAFVRELKRRQFDSATVIAARQAVMLRRLLQHAVATTSHYRHCAGCDLSQFPILSKQAVRDHGEELLSSAYANTDLIEKKTSGSTGIPLRVRIATDDRAWKRATTVRSDEWSGWRRGQCVAKAWGNPEYRHFGVRGWLRNRLYERAVHLDTLRMDSGAVADFARQLMRRQPGLIFGHAHSVYLVAQHFQRLGLPAPRPSGVITTAMVLHDFERRLIEKVFQCPVTNRYGCEEVSLIACECEAHSGLHINTDSVFIEIIADGRPAQAGEPGKVIVTDLTNFAMPLIRYEVGDVARWQVGACPCGRSMPRLAAIDGREADFVVTANGDMISGISLTENFATLVPGIAQLQIIQEELDRFRFRIVRDRTFTDGSIATIATLVATRFGERTSFSCEYVDAISPEPSGKYRFCISQVAASRIGRAAA